MGTTDGNFLPFTSSGAAIERQAIRVKAHLGVDTTAAIDPYKVLDRVPARLLDPEDFARGAPAHVREVLFETNTGDWSAIGWGSSPATGEALVLLNPTHHIHRQRASLMEE